MTKNFLDIFFNAQGKPCRVVSMQCWPRFEQWWGALFWNVPIQSGIFYICYYLSFNGVFFTFFLYPFPLTVQNYIQLSLCTTNPWYNELPGVTNYTILQNKRMRRLPPPPPTNNFPLSYPNKLYIAGKRIYLRVRIILNIGKIFWFRDFMSNFREIVGFQAIFGSSKKFQTLRTQIYHLSFWSGWSGDS